ncbi:MAG: hypothetical protein VCC00_00705 [Deltaproteobacteria bacterium]
MRLSGWIRFVIFTLVLGLVGALGGPQPANAGGKIAIGEDSWISVGAGLRGSFKMREDSAPDGGWSKDFNLDNARIYLGGQITENIKIEVNTECIFCGNADLQRFALLDAIAKIEVNQYVNIWAGRVLVPADRREMNGPFYSTTYDAFKTPFFSSDFSTQYGDGGAGVYGRDNGGNIWGAAFDEKFQYVVGAFTGLRAGPNQGDHLLYAGRFAYNFLNRERNPGYYTSGSYFGTAGDILTVAAAFQYQSDGAGSKENASDFFGLSIDVLFEKPIADVGVFTFDGEYKYFDADYDAAAFGDSGNFGMFRGNAFTVIGLYLMPEKIGIGKFQPYVRATGIYPEKSTDRSELEIGTNYVIDGFNARVSLFYQYGDIATKGLNYAPEAQGEDISSIWLAVQLQI